MKNILVPVDFSPFSRSAARAAVFLCHSTNAVIHLLHVVQAPYDWSRLSAEAKQKLPQIEVLIEEAENKIKKLSSDLLFGGCKVKTAVAGGVIYDNIVDYASRHKIDLITIGAHGAGESNAMFIGSTTQRVIHMAGCPVLSVKKDTELNAIGKILFLSNFEENVSPAIASVKGLAEAMEAQVDLLYVNTPGNFIDTETAEKRMTKYMPAENHVRFQSFIYNDVDRDKGMLNFMRKRKPDLVAMITHRYKGKPAYFLSVTDTILFHSRVPVLSMVLSG